MKLNPTLPFPSNIKIWIPDQAIYSTPLYLINNIISLSINLVFHISWGVKNFNIHIINAFSLSWVLYIRLHFKTSPLIFFLLSRWQQTQEFKSSTQNSIIFPLFPGKAKQENSTFIHFTLKPCFTLGSRRVILIRWNRKTHFSFNKWIWESHVYHTQ